MEVVSLFEFRRYCSMSTVFEDFISKIFVSRLGSLILLAIKLSKIQSGNSLKSSKNVYVEGIVKFICSI